MTVFRGEEVLRILALAECKIADIFCWQVYGVQRALQEFAEDDELSVGPSEVGDATGERDARQRRVARDGGND